MDYSGVIRTKTVLGTRYYPFYIEQQNHIGVYTVWIENDATYCFGRITTESSGTVHNLPTWLTIQ